MPIIKKEQYTLDTDNKTIELHKETSITISELERLMKEDDTYDLIFGESYSFSNNGNLPVFECCGGVSVVKNCTFTSSGNTAI